MPNWAWASDRDSIADQQAGTLSVEQLIVIIFNYPGIIMTAIAFAVAFGIGAIFGTDAEGPLMIVAGPLLAGMDIAYRLNRKHGHLYIPDRGGSLFFLPAWAFGAFWFVLGIVYTVQGNS